MFKESTFTVYNASAGSGKTFTLVKEYLKILLQSDNLYLFKNILAITFTNKAVNEMKERIIKTLSQFSEESILHSDHPMFEQICDELELSADTVHKKSKKLLEIIMHNYAAFDISTIDGFTHKLIRTFAFDLKLSYNFEVELDSEAFLNEAVDSLIAKTGIDNQLTKILVDFAIEKADDDRSWDIAYDFNKIGKLLFNEHHLKYIHLLKNKSFEDFKSLKATLIREIKITENVIVQKSNEFLRLIEEHGLQFEDFSGNFLPKHFLKLSQKQFDLNFTTKWQNDIENNPLYPKRVPDDIADVIDQIQPMIAFLFYETKKQVFHLKFLKAFYKNITPLSVLHAINKELSNLKEEQNKVLISDFNSLISNEIKNQPSPFIYERIGEKFRHYFIDEFQDTSILQWQNLMPLIDNVLSTENSSTLLVGDAKQAIYRWRGGQAEQFIGLIGNDEPFQIKKKNKQLNENYRSSKEIVKFNNSFFKYLAPKIFNNESYEALYNASEQVIEVDNIGYVELNFLDLKKENDKDSVYALKVLDIIKDCLENNFQYKDICILVRKREKEAVPLANFLNQNEIPIISSDSLLLDNSPKVQFIHNFLNLLVDPKNHLIKVEILGFLISHYNIKDKHDFYDKHILLNLENLLSSLHSLGLSLDYNHVMQLSLYDVVESLVKEFHLIKDSDAYVQSYMDLILDFSNKKGSDFNGFLNYFDQNRDRLSISSPSDQDAVQIMTIHKSKGLEFPVVIFPYADLDIYSEIDPQEWFNVVEENFNDFSHALLNYNKDIQYFGDQGYNIHERHKSELQLDNINLLYVTLTRAVEHLYILSKNDSLSSNKFQNYSDMFIGYLQELGIWNNSQLTYHFGQKERATTFDSSKTAILNPSKFISTSQESHNIDIVTKSGYLWDTDQEYAIEKGNLMHEILSHIQTMEDINPALSLFIGKGIIDKQQAKIIARQINQLIRHPNLHPYFNKNLVIHNERDIIAPTGQSLRPDRVIINDKNQAIILDYKTGSYNAHHAQQLQLYQDILESMNIKVIKKYLVYLNNDIEVKEI